MNNITQLVLLCRPGFEKECAGEIMDYASELGFPAYIQTKPDTGYVLLIGAGEPNISELIPQLDFKQLIFTRQWFASLPKLNDLPEQNRITPIINAIKLLDQDFNDIELAYPDTNEGKSLSRFCKQFNPHLLAALKKQKLLSAHSGQRLHILFLDSQQAFVGSTPIENSAQIAMGIPRLRMPSSAPSRSTLKLEEAIHWFIDDESKVIKNGMTAVDLGAAPGGWSWQLVQRGLLVTAIDNGPMEGKLMRGGMVEHYKTDAFTYRPKKTIDWLVCDMAERPSLVSKLIAKWFTRKDCNNAIFNLKLPMKKRLQAVNECLDQIHQDLNGADIPHQIQAKHLYHDREEITVCIMTL
ncbi:MAG: 23S rRNA (cytidine(2498)-2'-O)-methyltransferase RlmM [Gammaproteobacteria bacterium]|nr:23S rRNA (cytidine(2498)-2'-O)-methyltransferase RlmM [Gammaproteobacteria bacterium]MCK5262385.1 23S rRNA (cytidine(2498)-2'-O)-methyltransferase RlmM [Gammaproteobacteria bacterium]